MIHSPPLFAGRTAVRIASRIIVTRPHTGDPLTAARDPRRAQRPADFNADAATSFGSSPLEGPGADFEKHAGDKAASARFGPRPYQPKSGSIDFVEDEFRRDRAFALPAVC